MCECLDKIISSELKALIIEKAPDTFPETIKLDTILTVFPEVRSYPRMRILYNKKGVKKTYEMTLQPSFCPFCGEKYK